MTRREFMKTTSTSVAVAAATGTPPQPPGLPKTQSSPSPDLGSHWPVFEQISAACVPRISYLNDEFQDSASWAERARARLLEHFHYRPAPCDPNPETLERLDRGAYIRERVLINTTPAIRIPVYVLIPKERHGKLPGVVVLHDHGGFYLWGKEKVVDVEPEHPALAEHKRMYYGGRGIADELARRGFAVLAADMLHWGERGLFLDDDPPRLRGRTQEVTEQDVGEFNARSWAHEELLGRTALACGATWSGIIVWDDIRTVDYFISREEVDPNRVGCLGLSVGAVRTMFLGGIHPAVRASVAVCWMAEYQSMIRNHVRNGIGFTKLVPGLYNDLDWPDLAGLHWPGHLMTINGLQDKLYPIEAARNAVEKIKRVFAKLGAPENYERVFFDGPHEFNRDMQELAFDWMRRRLA